tara:strand:+ start:4235 stop:4663 length:429 start_codon:yes stop_codon:yes gene_type:complete
MDNPKILFGEPIEKTFFYDLLIDKDSKYLTEFKRYFNYLKKNHDDYKNLSIKDKVSLDKPLFDYVFIINDWLELESEGLYNIYMDKTENLFFGFKISNPVDVDTINKLCKEWKKNNKFRKHYFEWISKFDDSGEGPLLFALN